MALVEFEGTGIKTTERLSSFYNSIATYRTVAVADAIDPASPPTLEAVGDVPAEMASIDNRSSGIGNNEMHVYADSGIGTATLVVWVVTANNDWYFHSTHDLAANIPLCWHVTNLPAIRYVIAVAASTAAVSLREAHTV